ncbi:MAG: AMP-binding protein [Acidobacteria bacterium]|nr:AMP-binding protein [Acidobacteriota bacterium]
MNSISFLAQIFASLEAAADQTILTELVEAGPVTASGRDLLRLISQARAFLRSRNLRKGDRCALVGTNGIRWIAMDLAVIAEGLIVVPLYYRQTPEELVATMKDCSPSLLCCGSRELGAGITAVWPEAPPQVSFEEVFLAPGQETNEMNAEQGDDDVVAILYTSGTSGEAKGVMITAGNVAHILKSTSARLDILMNQRPGQDRVYQWAPLNFAAAWITLLTGFVRQSSIFMNTDLTKLAQEIRVVAPDYFVNVPALLERVRRAVDEQLWRTGGVALAIYRRSKAAYMRRHEGSTRSSDFLWLALANSLVFPTIRKKMIGSRLKALISGSAPLNVDTQLYFMMLGIPVLQVYGLTETTAICTMDDPRRVEPGRVGSAIAGTEMKLSEDNEILVHGPNVFAGYWNRPEETKKVLAGGWFHTGDLGEVNSAGNWKIVGRIKNLIILSSGHNIAPEPIEEQILARLPAGAQLVLVGNGRGYLSALLTGSIADDQLQSVLDEVNATLPHYKQVRKFCISAEPFTIDNNLLTHNGKLRRELIANRFRTEIEEMYAIRQAV